MKKTSTFQLVLMSAMVALLCVSSLIKIPLVFSPVPITLQTLLIYLTALLLSPGQTALTITVYLLLGLVGLPVFAGGNSGPGAFVGGTGGYLIGFLLAGIFISLLKGKTANPLRYSILMILGTVMIYLLGNFTVSMVAHTGYLAAFSLSTFPYIPGDIIKIILAVVLASLLKKQLPYLRDPQ